MPVPETGHGRADIVTNLEVDYFAFANMLIDQHGADAGAKAARLMQEARREADPDAVADWLAVAQAITLLISNSAATMN